MCGHLSLASISSEFSRIWYIGWIRSEGAPIARCRVKDRGAGRSDSAAAQKACSQYIALRSQKAQEARHDESPVRSPAPHCLATRHQKQVNCCANLFKVVKHVEINTELILLQALNRTNNV